MCPSEALDIIIEELDNVFYGGQDIDEVTARMKKRVDPILQSR